jgi:hypothetical protein
MNTAQDFSLFTIQIINSIVQIASLIFLIIYVVKTWEMASATRKSALATEKSVFEMQETRDGETAPYVVIYFDISIGPRLIYLVVKNIGHTVATDIKLIFNPPLQSSNPGRIEQVFFLKNGIASMPPGYEIRTLIDSGPAYFRDERLPLQYQVKVSYFGGLKTDERILDQTIDLSAQKGIAYVIDKNMDDLVNKIEGLTTETGRIRKSISDISNTFNEGLFLNNSTFIVKSIKPGMSNWPDMVKAILKEFENIWLFTFKDNREGGHYYVESLQMRISLLNNQLITLLSCSPENVSSDLVNSIAALTGRFYELSQMPFYIDGEDSINAFNGLGDTIIQDVQVLKTQLNF